MAKSSLLAEIDSAVAAKAREAKRKTWFEFLPDDDQAVLIAARKKFHDGGYEISRTTLARVLLTYAANRGLKTCDIKRMAEWLAQG